MAIVGVMKKRKMKTTKSQEMVKLKATVLAAVQSKGSVSVGKMLF